MLQGCIFTTGGGSAEPPPLTEKPLRCFTLRPPPPVGTVCKTQSQGGLGGRHQLLLAGGFLQEVFIRLTKRVEQTFSDQVVHILCFS